MKMNWNTLLCEKRRREHSSKESTDLRSEFQKDYHRIIQSASFRRLQDKTQVFPLDKSDFVRTRLTHSLEVSLNVRDLSMTSAIPRSVTSARIISVNGSEQICLR